MEYHGDLDRSLTWVEQKTKNTISIELNTNTLLKGLKCHTSSIDADS